MRIPCPFCGERGSEEFSYQGDAAVQRPSGPEAPVTAWADYVYQRDNIAGPHSEFWYHGGGCHAWLRVKRDTRTHAILSVEAAH